jgi:hypothetical protein
MSAPAASWCDPAGESPAQVKVASCLVASVAWPLATVVAKRTQQLHGVWDRATKGQTLQGPRVFARGRRRRFLRAAGHPPRDLNP